VTKGRLDAALVRRHLLGLDRAMAQLQKHVERPVEELEDFRAYARFVETWLEARGQ